MDTSLRQPLVLLSLLMLSACAHVNPRDALERSSALAAAGHYGEAYVSLRSASEADPANAELRNAALLARERYAAQIRQRAERALAAGRYEEARNAYAQLGAVPGHEDEARRGEQALQGAMIRQFEPAGGASAPSGSAPAPLRAESIAPVAAPAPSVRTSVSTAPRTQDVPGLDRRVTLEFRNASVRSMFDVIARTSGFNVIFDRDVPAELSTTVFLRNTTVHAAIEKIVLTSGLAWRMLDEHTLLVYMDDSAKQRDYQSLVVRSFQLENADAKFVANSLRTVLRFRDMVVDEKLNMIVVRDTPESIRMAEKLVAMHDVPEPEVMLEVAILEVSRGRLQNLGVAWPQSLSLGPLARTVAGSATSTTTSTSTVTTSTGNILTVRDLFNLTPGSLTLSMDNLALNMGATDNDINILANPRIRAKNREKARVLIGERVPNISATATSNGVVSQNITYVDVGLKLDVEPQVFPGNEIALKIGMEVSSINSTVENKANGMVAYRIGTRNAATVLRLKDGENQILAGLIQDTDRKSVSKVPLLGDIPVLGRLFRSDADDKGKTEIVLSITPHLIRGNQIRASTDTRFDAGTQASLRGRRDGEALPAAESTPSAPQPQVQQIQLVPNFSNSDGNRNTNDNAPRGFGQND